MKLRDDIGLINQGMALEVAAPADKWVVAYHQVPDTHPPDRKIPACSSVYGVPVGIAAGVPTLLPITLGGSMACGASMPCGAGTSKELSTVPGEMAILNKRSTSSQMGFETLAFSPRLT